MLEPGDENLIAAHSDRQTSAMSLYDDSVALPLKMEIVRDALSTGRSPDEAVEWLNRCLPDPRYGDIYSGVLQAVDPADVSLATSLVKAYVRMAERTSWVHPTYGLLTAFTLTYVAWTMGSLLGRLYARAPAETKTLFRECSSLRIVSYDCFEYASSHVALLEVLAR